MVYIKMSQTEYERKQEDFLEKLITVGFKEAKIIKNTKPKCNRIVEDKELLIVK